MGYDAEPSIEALMKTKTSTGQLDLDAAANLLEADRTQSSKARPPPPPLPWRPPPLPKGLSPRATMVAALVDRGYEAEPSRIALMKTKTSTGQLDLEAAANLLASRTTQSI